MIVFTALSIAIPRKVFFEYWLDAGHRHDVSALQRHLFTSEHESGPPRDAGGVLGPCDRKLETVH